MKIDTSLIEGFAEMSPEDQNKALLDFEFEDHSETVKSQKALIDKYASEIAGYKKKEKEGMDGAAAKQLELDERIKALEEENATLKSDKAKASYKASYIAMGYDEKLAARKAEAVVEGDMDKVLKIEAEYKESIEKSIRAEILKGTKKPDDKGSPDEMTKEKLLKMSPADRLKYSQEHKEEYAKLYGGK